jgi:hypothetical protein
MPFCPNCRTEYTSSASNCADCGATLVASLPQERGWSPTGDSDGTRPVELCEIGDLVRLDMVEAQLRAAEIPTVRRPRTVALFVPASHAKSAQRVLEGKSAMAIPDSTGLSGLHRVWISCEECDAGVLIDLLTEKVPEQCAECGRYYDLTAVRPVLDRYADVMRTMADADFEIYVELPEAEEE